MLCLSGHRLVFSVVNDIFRLPFCQKKKIITTVRFFFLLVKLGSGIRFLIHTKIILGLAFVFVHPKMSSLYVPTPKISCSRWLLPFTVGHFVTTIDVRFLPACVCVLPGRYGGPLSRCAPTRTSTTATACASCSRWTGSVGWWPDAGRQISPRAKYPPPVSFGRLTRRGEALQRGWNMTRDVALGPVPNVLTSAPVKIYLQQRGLLA